MSDKVYFFGCNPASGAGHYLFGSKFMQPDTKHDMRAKLFNMMDGVLVDTNSKPYLINVTDFDGIQYKAYSYVDHSVDSRGGSNSNIFIPFKLIKHDNVKDDFVYQLYTHFPTLYRHYKSKNIVFFTGYQENFVLIDADR